jgi:hypothetical protein
VVQADYLTDYLAIMRPMRKAPAGPLTVSDRTRIANIVLIRHYTVADFHLGGD